jgi:hypothetical protein
VADEVAGARADEHDGARVGGFGGVEAALQSGDGSLVHHAVVARDELDDTDGLAVSHGSASLSQSRVKRIGI